MVGLEVNVVEIKITVMKGLRNDQIRGLEFVLPLVSTPPLPHKSSQQQRSQ